MDISKHLSSPSSYSDMPDSLKEKLFNSPLFDVFCLEVSPSSKKVVEREMDFEFDSFLFNNVDAKRVMFPKFNDIEPIEEEDSFECEFTDKEESGVTLRSIDLRYSTVSISKVQNSLNIRDIDFIKSDDSKRMMQQLDTVNGITKESNIFAYDSCFDENLRRSVLNLTEYINKDNQKIPTKTSLQCVSNSLILNKNFSHNNIETEKENQQSNFKRDFESIKKDKGFKNLLSYIKERRTKPEQTESNLSCNKTRRCTLKTDSIKQDKENRLNGGKMFISNSSVSLKD